MDFILIILMNNDFESNLLNLSLWYYVCAAQGQHLVLELPPGSFDVKIASDIVFIEAKEKAPFPEI